MDNPITRGRGLRLRERRDLEDLRRRIAELDEADRRYHEHSIRQLEAELLATREREERLQDELTRVEAEREQLEEELAGTREAMRGLTKAIEELTNTAVGRFLELEARFEATVETVSELGDSISKQKRS